MDLIDAHLAHCRAAGFSRNTIDDREALLRRMDGSLPMGLRQATVEELEDWLAREGWSVQTRATYYGHVRGFFTWATDKTRPLLDFDPSASLRRPRVPATLPRPVTDAELAMARGRARKPWRLCVDLAAYGGLRCCELAIIRKEDITERWMVITGKGGKTRSVPTSPEVWRTVQEMPPGRLIGRTAENIARSGNRHLHTIGLREVTMHRFRHWFGTWLLRPEKLGGAGADLRTVQELMGHSSPATTAVYTQITDEQRQMAIAALPVVAPASA